MNWFRKRREQAEQEFDDELQRELKYWRKGDSVSMCSGREYGEKHYGVLFAWDESSVVLEQMSSGRKHYFEFDLDEYPGANNEDCNHRENIMESKLLKKEKAGYMEMCSQFQSELKRLEHGFDMRSATKKIERKAK